jgi:UDP-glucuronate 4-epimerase
VRVVITGAAGFIGSHLSERLLSDGHTVVGIDNFDDFYAPERKRGNLAGLIDDVRFTLVETDVGDAAAVRPALAGADAVVHLAARAGVRPSFGAADVYVRTNVSATACLLEAVTELRIPRLVFISSSTVYGDGVEAPFREAGELGVPKSPYAATKVAGEMLCRAMAHRVPNLTILRLFSVYGPRQRPDLAIHKFARCIESGEPIPVLGTTDSFRDYTYVDDIVDAIAAALDLDEPWAILNLASGAPVTLEQMITGLQHALSRKVPRRLLPPHPGDMFGTWADIAAAKRLLGWEPAWTFDRGVERFAEWFLESEGNRLPERQAA